MSKKQLGAVHDGENVSEGSRPGRIERMKALPGFRTAAVAFVLTVVLGVGSTIAYAYWSQSATVAITGTTRSELPVNTALMSNPPALSARPGTPSPGSCTPALSHEQMANNTYADINFAWTPAAAATKYVVTVKSTNPDYKFADGVTKLDEKTVTQPQVSFQFKRLLSKTNGDQQDGPAPFYTKYTVRVMPMTGDVAGDPLYFTYQYEHRNGSNCYWSAAAGASPLGSVAPVSCIDPLTVGGPDGYTDLRMRWSPSSGAASYSVTMLNSDRSYGGEISVTGTSASFRIMRPQPESSQAPYFSSYSVRVQPMNGGKAGDPVYLQGFQFYTWGQKC